MAERLQFDLVAVGGGFAGLCAALRGAELGLRTAIVEAGADDGYLCSSRWAGGIFHVSYHDVKLSPDELIAAINRQTGGDADPELAAAIAEDSARTVNWLASQGAEFVQASPITWHRFTLGPPRAAVAGQDWQGRGPDRMLGELRRRLEKRQGRMFLGTRASALRIERGRCVGIEARRGGDQFDIGAKAIVIADGGFPGDAELFRKHIGPRPDRVLMRHAGTAIGDGLRMAEAAGAAITRLDRFYGHLLSRDAMDNPGLWPYPQIDAVATAAIVVDAAGKRLLDEGLGGISITNDLAPLKTRFARPSSATRRFGRPPAKPRRYRPIRSFLPGAAGYTKPTRWPILPMRLAYLPRVSPRPWPATTTRFAVATWRRFSPPVRRAAASRTRSKPLRSLRSDLRRHHQHDGRHRH
jgi:fumarate reductase flavoprotein subunit